MGANRFYGGEPFLLVAKENPCVPRSSLYVWRFGDELGDDICLYQEQRREMYHASIPFSAYIKTNLEALVYVITH